MTEVEFVDLESKIEMLLKSRDQLKAENASLRQKLTKITQQRAELLDKNQKAAAKIRRFIEQLRNEIQ